MPWGSSRVGMVAVALAVVAAVASAQEPPALEGVAVLPVESLAADLPPLEAIRDRVQEALAARGLATVAIPDVDASLAFVRARWSGGVDRALAQALRERAGARLAFLISVAQWDADESPRVALAARLVSLDGEEPTPLWAVSVHLAGDDAPGFLARGLVFDLDVLVDRAVAGIADETAAFLAAGRRRPETLKESRPERRFRPRSLSVTEQPPAAEGAKPRVAVLSFRNQSPHPHAGEIAALATAQELLRTGRYQVVERGIVREAQLETRMIQEGGISLAQADVLRALLEVDLVVTGSVSEYRDGRPGRPPVIDFTAYAVDTREKRVGWLSRSRGEGNQGVFFFGLGSVQTASGLTRSLVRALLRQIDSESK